MLPCLQTLVGQVLSSSQYSDGVWASHLPVHNLLIFFHIFNLSFQSIYAFFSNRRTIMCVFQRVASCFLNIYEQLFFIQKKDINNRVHFLIFFGPLLKGQLPFLAIFLFSTRPEACSPQVSPMASVETFHDYQCVRYMTSLSRFPSASLSSLVLSWGMDWL